MMKDLTTEWDAMMEVKESALTNIATRHKQFEEDLCKSIEVINNNSKEFSETHVTINKDLSDIDEMLNDLLS